MHVSPPNNEILRLRRLGQETMEPKERKG